MFLITFYLVFQTVLAMLGGSVLTVGGSFGFFVCLAVMLPDSSSTLTKYASAKLIVGATLNFAAVLLGLTLIGWSIMRFF